MSSHTYVCAECGGLRRRPAVYPRPGQPLPYSYPRCCGTPMHGLRKGYAEAATHLDAPGRVEWLARGAHIVLKPGRRWRAALSPREVSIARDQVARWLRRGSPGPSTNRPRHG